MFPRIYIYNYILLEFSGSHSNIISDSYIFHYGNELVSRTVNKEIRHFVTTNYDQKYPFAQPSTIFGHICSGQMATWIKMEVGLGPGDFVLDGDPAPLPKKGAEPPNFRPMSVVAKRLDGSRWH